MDISVVMCTFNGERYIDDQIKSILNQTQKPNEIIISDDMSDDKTVYIAQSILRKSKINHKIIRNKKRLGCVKNFENALKNAAGDVIFLADQDDYWEENKIETVMPFFADENVWLVFHDAKLADGNLDVISKSWFDEIGINLHKFNTGDYSDLLIKNYIQGAATAFRADLLVKAVPFSKYSYHDEWLGLVTMMNKKRIIGIPNTLIKYRQWGGNTLGVESRKINYYIRKMIDAKKLSSENVKEMMRRIKLFEDMMKMGEVPNNMDIIRGMAGMYYRIFVYENRKMPNIFYYKAFYTKSRWRNMYVKDMVTYLIGCFG